jgi:hypothetical protein
MVECVLPVEPLVKESSVKVSELSGSLADAGMDSANPPTVTYVSNVGVS